MLRYRGPSKKVIESVKELDAFGKVPESYVETSTSGGTISLITCLLILFLVISEIAYFFDTRFEYDYKVDIDFDAKVLLNFDITIATPCILIGADVVDITGKAFVFDDEVVEQPVQFELSSAAAGRQLQLLSIKKHLVNFEDGRKLSEFALKDGFNATALFDDRKSESKVENPNACRFYGHIPLPKVAGNFHVVSGKPLSVFGGHAHLSFIHSTNVHNFSHRIDHLSFGDMRAGFINALDGDNKIATNENHVFQYYLEIVSTKINTRRVKTDTYQFSVSDISRELDHTAGSHGTPGIFFKYDFSPLTVIITEKHMPLGRFLVRLCGIIGGVFATSCIVNGIVHFIQNVYYEFFPHLMQEELPSEGQKPLSNGLQPVNVPLLSTNVQLIPS
ncbi:unnamed protein product [Clavelina lepadiformis]|uniref:Endoplasmic reticulum-Golgi intermediate compartment protein 2 n=1 Tax=Clavelina lepadiformis TaxID=159417 RepID=A0ABP0FHJ1_CLALP